MKLKKSKGFDIKHLLIGFFLILLIIIIFAFFDYLIHNLSEEYAVPSYYYRNKVIYGTLWGFVVYLFVRKKKTFPKSLIISLVVSILLQIRYFLEGYSKSFVLEFLFIHLGILLLVSWLVFKFAKV